MEEYISNFRIKDLFLKSIDTIHIFYITLDKRVNDYQSPCFPSLLASELKFVEWKKQKPLSQTLVFTDNLKQEYLMKRSILSINIKKDHILKDPLINEYIRNKYIESKLVDILIGTLEENVIGLFGVSYIESESILVTEKIIMAKKETKLVKFKRKNISKFIEALLKIIESLQASKIAIPKIPEQFESKEEKADANQDKNSLDIQDKPKYENLNPYSMDIIIITKGICSPEIYSFEKLDISSSKYYDHISKDSAPKYISYSISFLFLEALLPQGITTMNFIETLNNKKLKQNEYNALINPLIKKAIAKFAGTNIYEQIGLLLKKGLSFNLNQRLNLEELNNSLQNIISSKDINLMNINGYLSSKDYLKDANLILNPDQDEDSKLFDSSSSNISNEFLNETNQEKLFESNDQISTVKTKKGYSSKEKYEGFQKNPLEFSSKYQSTKALEDNDTDLSVLGIFFCKITYYYFLESKYIDCYNCLRNYPSLAKRILLLLVPILFLIALSYMQFPIPFYFNNDLSSNLNNNNKTNGYIEKTLEIGSQNQTISNSINPSRYENISNTQKVETNLNLTSLGENDHDVEECNNYNREDKCPSKRYKDKKIKKKDDQQAKDKANNTASQKYSNQDIAAFNLANSNNESLKNETMENIEKKKVSNASEQNIEETPSDLPRKLNESHENWTIESSTLDSSNESISQSQASHFTSEFERNINIIQKDYPRNSFLHSEVNNMHTFQNKDMSIKETLPDKLYIPDINFSNYKNSYLDLKPFLSQTKSNLYKEYTSNESKMKKQKKKLKIKHPKTKETYTPSSIE